jgi:DNA invertase Pin-like site-specific DNA recombinase
LGRHAGYIDQASGKTSERDSFKRLFEDASRRAFDVVLVWALDRFTREGVLETFEHVQRLTHFGIAFESYTEQHFRTTGPAGELMLAIAAWMRSRSGSEYLIARRPGWSVRDGRGRYPADPNGCFGVTR